MEQNRIKELRKERKITQVQLAKILNTSQGTIQKLETGQVPLDTRWMRNISSALCVEPYELLPLDMQPKEITPEEREILRMIRKTTAPQAADNNDLSAQANNPQNSNPAPQPPHKTTSNGR